MRYLNGAFINSMTPINSLDLIKWVIEIPLSNQYVTLFGFVSKKASRQPTLFFKKVGITTYVFGVLL
jgi:hypothetical protein